MELDKLRYFRTVVQFENISAAARALYISQSALSRVISRMEAELGLTLFDRSGNKITPNANGRRFYACVDQILDAYDECLTDLQLTLKENPLAIAYTKDVNLEFLVDACQSQFPHIPIHAVNVDADEIRKMEESRSLYAAFMVHDENIPPDWVKLYPVQWCLVAHVDHPLSRKADPPVLLDFEEYTTLFCGAKETFAQLQQVYAHYRMETFHLIHDLPSLSTTSVLTQKRACGILNDSQACDLLRARPNVQLVVRPIVEPSMQHYVCAKRIAGYPQDEEFEQIYTILCESLQKSHAACMELIAERSRL